jgi:hypothetical protein
LVLPVRLSAGPRPGSPPGLVYLAKRDRSHDPVRKGTLLDESKDDTVARLSASERVAVVWPLSVQAWQFKGARLL